MYLCAYYLRHTKYVVFITFFKKKKNIFLKKEDFLKKCSIINIRKWSKVEQSGELGKRGYLCF